MIRIDGRWEKIETLHDVSRVVRDNYSWELANVMDKLIEELEEREDESYRIEELEEAISEIRSIVRSV